MSLPSPTWADTASSPAAKAAFLNSNTSLAVFHMASLISIAICIRHHGTRSSSHRKNEGFQVYAEVGTSRIRKNKGDSVGLGLQESSVYDARARPIYVNVTYVKALMYSTNLFSSCFSSESKDQPSPPWPTSSSAVRVIQLRTSISLAPDAICLASPLRS